MRSAAAAAFVAMLALPLLGSTPASATDIGTVTQVTEGNNKSTVPSLDADGDAVAFHSSATNLPGGNTSTANIDNVFSTNPTALPAVFTRHTDGDGGQRGSFPDISANGQWIVYTSTDATGSTNQINRVNVSNGSTTVVAVGNDDSGTLFNLPGARVANDGSVVFMSLATGFGNDTENDTVLYDNGTPGNPNDDIAVEGWDIFHWNNGAITKMSDGSQPNFLFPDISADGSRITYQSSDTFNAFTPPSGIATATIGAERKVYTNNSSGGNQQVIANGNGRDELPRISDDGSTIVFRSDSTNLAGNNATPNALVWTTNGISRASNETGISGVTNPNISGDGSVVVYAYEGEIYRQAAGGGSRIQLSDHGGSAVFIDYASPNLDGSRVAFAQSLNNSAQGVEVMLWEEPAPAGAPDAPTAVTASTTGQTSAMVSFTPGADNGSNVTSFTVTASPGGATATGGTSPISVSGLAPNTTYTFTVEATNAVGTSPAGGPSNAVTTDADTPACGPILSGTYQGMSGTDGRIARLYAAYFLRSPDSAGFQFWQTRIANGQWTNDDAATFFSESAEFQALYGTGLSNADFVGLLYQNVLCRNADAGGEAYWLDLMNNQGWSRGQVALGFSDSAEFRQRTNTN